MDKGVLKKLSNEQEKEHCLEEETLEGQGVCVLTDEEESDESLEIVEEALDEVAQSALIEAIILAHGEPIGFSLLKEVSGIEKDSVLKDILESIQMKFELEDSGIELQTFSGKYQFRTKGKFSSYLQKLKSGRPRRLSPPALETLAIIAYRQPIVKSDVEKIRGVDATPTIKTLLDRGIVRIVGHQATVGQPALYGTTEKFLSIFGLSSLSELPTLRELKELDEDPGEPDESIEEDEDLGTNGESSEEEMEELEAPEGDSEEQLQVANS